MAIDVTDAMKAKDSLQESKTQLSMFIEHSPAALAMFDNDMRYIVTSKRWINDYHLNEDIIGKSLYEVFPGITTYWKELHQRCLNGAIVKNDEDAYIRPDGKMELLRYEFRPWHKANGEIGGIIVFTEVITERKKMSEWFTQQFQNSPDTIIFINKNYAIESINHQLPGSKMPEELIGSSCIDILPESNKESVRTAINKCFETNIKQEIEITLPHGEWATARLVPITIGGDVVRHVMLIVTDITEKKNFEEQQLLISSIVNSSDDAIISKTLDGQITSWNHGAEKILGYTAEEIIGHNIKIIVPPILLAEQKEILKNLASGKSVNHFETKRIRKDGQLINVSLTISPILNSNGQIVGASKVLRDVTDRVNAEKEIKDTSERLRQLTGHLLNVREEERIRIGREIHDELGQQITAMKMNVAWIDKKTPEENQLLKSELKNLLTLLNGSNLSIRRILNELRPAILDEYGLLEAIEWHANNFMQTSGIPIEISTTETHPKVPEEISVCIFRVFQESLTNILKHAEAKQVFVYLQISKDSIVLSVIDDGNGFNAGKINQKKSFGILGMTERVKILNGTFELITAPKHGTKIIVTIPLKITT